MSYYDQLTELTNKTIQNEGIINYFQYCMYFINIIITLIDINELNNRSRIKKQRVEQDNDNPIDNDIILINDDK